MLVLTRRADKQDESVIVIGEGIEIRVLETHGEEVRIGVTAPCKTAVHRKEIWLKKQEETATVVRACVVAG